MKIETARKLATEIWGKTESVQLRPDGGADIDTGTEYHRLDKHGRVACHTSCQDKQKSFVQAEWLKGNP
jgi:hypothetical protein